MSKPVALEDVTGGSAKATHLCVLVHGLWGNPSHLRNVAKALRDEYSEDELYILPAEKNCGSFTYDGIELGGERVCAEIEEKLRNIEEQGGKITKLSIAGYSLGGLVSRYAVGLLYAKGILDDLECMNFTTFASPHLGVRTPLKGWLNNIWNVLGARTLSMSGRQLFTIDKFRDTNRPLLAVLADPDSIFMSGLKKFKRRTLYTNIVNDRSVVHYTSAITKHDPYTDIEKVNLNYVKGYEGVILDPDHPIAPRPKVRQDTLLTDYEALKKWVKSIPFMVTVGVIIPVGVVVFLANSAVQTVRSANRIKAHESGEAGLKIEQYRMPLRIKEIREEVEQAYEALNSSQNQQYLAASDSEDDLAYDAEDRKLLKKERRMSTPGQPTLALTPDQFEMIENLDAAGWRKFPVHIQKHRHSHAAIVVRMDKESFADGWVVLKHFAGNQVTLIRHTPTPWHLLLEPATMVLTHTTNHNYNHPFPTVTLAYFLRYSSPQLNPFAAHVLSTDTIESYVDPKTRRLHTTRIHLKKSRMPGAVYKLLPASVTGGGSGDKASYILETSVVDIKEGWMKTESRNLNFTGVLSVIEKQEFNVPTEGVAQNPNETAVTTMVQFRSRLGDKIRGKLGQAQEDGWFKNGIIGGWGTKGIQRSIESIASTKTQDQMGKSRDGMKLVLERLRNNGVMGVLETIRRERQRQLA
ncbi:putative serine esterase-domain-containing protein [Fusarium redolens]|uniref:Serine esterase-domain-containing protein n=1 Tax=Fusarium redolens TaxID=48865 RepID=A0A9P9HDF3_FUSRE|nr:putative serine esterase-domain-containing protein [Fusarium redolens]KAH7255466.1 putative serine esterase-domain-containing protein [Fusarium redolens]